MHVFRFIHAADLHLDAATKGLGQDVPETLQKDIQEATFTALKRLVDLCIERKVDALLLAGDLYNKEDGSVRAQLALRDACVRLDEACIVVLMVHGNHDPLQSRIHSLQWPKNTVIFDTEYTQYPLLPQMTSEYADQPSKPLAIIHGISHPTADEKRNLAQKFHRTDDRCPQIGLLHCTIGADDGKQRYAPCSVEDLKDTGMDYWALGHIHLRQELCNTPPVFYSGSLQGLHIGEEGLHGCMLIEIDGNNLVHTTYEPLSPVVWQHITVNIEEMPSTSQDDGQKQLTDGYIDDITSLVVEKIEDFCKTMPSNCQNMLFRITFIGSGILNTVLRNEKKLSDLLSHLRDELISTSSPSCWIKDLKVATRPAINMEALSEREDLLGATLQIANRAVSLVEGRAELLQTDADTMLLKNLREKLNALYAHPSAGKVLEELDNQTLASLISDARLLCIEGLEGE
ncbi:MAG: DNA repair exonuclease [Pseudomonadota bacterium]